MEFQIGHEEIGIVSPFFHKLVPTHCAHNLAILWSATTIV